MGAFFHDYIMPIIIAIAATVVMHLFSVRKEKESGKKQLINFVVKAEKIVEKMNTCSRLKINQQQNTDLLHRVIIGDLSEFQEEIEEGWKEEQIVELLQGLINDSKNNLNKINEEVKLIKAELNAIEINKVDSRIYKEIKRILEHEVTLENYNQISNLLERIDI